MNSYEEVFEELDEDEEHAFVGTNPHSRASNVGARPLLLLLLFLFRVSALRVRFLVSFSHLLLLLLLLLLFLGLCCCCCSPKGTFVT